MAAGLLAAALAAVPGDALAATTGDALTATTGAALAAAPGAALGAQAQPSPESPPPTPQPAEAPPAESSGTEAAQGTPPEAAPAPELRTQTPPAQGPQPPVARPRPAPVPARTAPASPAAAPHTGDVGRDAQLAALRQEVNRLQSALDAERAAAAQQPADAAGLMPRRAGTWLALTGAALLALAAGFVLGWRMLDRRIRRKYGGLRIY